MSSDDQRACKVWLLPPTTDQFIGTITTPNAEQQRLHEAKSSQPDWKRWGPYLSERQWGTVREDYSPHGNAWEYLPHDHSRSRAYRWGEDGIAGISDDQQRLCLSLALWNGKDPILKERLFGLTNSEGNHGEDVKELYYYLDATPTHSYLKLLYKYPQREFPYAWLVEENRRRGKDQPEFELLDTGIFDDDRYFDVFVEYAKAAPDDILMLVTVRNRGPETATIHLLPQLWFCDAWSWKNGAAKPRMYLGGAGDSPAPFGDSPNGTRENRSMSRRHTGLRAFPANPPGESPGGTGQWPVPPSVTAEHPELGSYEFYCESRPELLFCNNETNVRRLYGETDAPGYCKRCLPRIRHCRKRSGGESATDRHEGRRPLQAHDSQRRLPACSTATGQSRAGVPPALRGRLAREGFENEIE